MIKLFKGTRRLFIKGATHHQIHWITLSVQTVKNLTSTVRCFQPFHDEIIHLAALKTFSPHSQVCVEELSVLVLCGSSSQNTL